MRQLAVVIGRFSPPHKHHVLNLLDRARINYDQGLVLFGSSFSARDFKNPFRWEERKDLIQKACIDLWGECPFSFKGLKDYPESNNRWVLQVQKLVEEHLDALEAETGEEWQPVLVGADKDASTFYLKLFPQWESDVFEIEVEGPIISATDIRKGVFEERWSDIESLTTPSVVKWLQAWITTPEGRRIQEEYVRAHEHRLVLRILNKDGTLGIPPWGDTPVSHTVDNVVIWKGHVLLIERRFHPGKGLWALPGGYLNAWEWPRDGALREMQEETKVHFYMKGTRRRLRMNETWVRGHKQFASPGRSLGKRNITDAYYWVIPDEFEVDVRAEDDAAKAQWFPLYEVLEKMDFEIFEDHQSIIAHFALSPTF